MPRFFVAPREDWRWIEMADAKIPETHVDILDKRCFGNVATLRPDGELSCNPVSIVWQDGRVRFSSLVQTKKVRNLRADPRIAISILDPDDPTRYLEIRGRAEIEPDPDRKFINLMARKYMDMDEYPYDPPNAERVVITIRPVRVSTPPIQGND
jgi:PPOX class probable F420-dependent enzyme